MNLLEYRQQLLQLRGSLPDRADCVMDLRVRPSLRAHVLVEQHDFSWFLSADQYSAADRAADANWVQEQMARTQNEKDEILALLKAQGITTSPWSTPPDDQAVKALAQFPFYPGFYNPRSFSSYEVNSPLPIWTKEGYVYKVFFEFQNPELDFTPERYHEFSRRLALAGFRGDSKIPLLDGWIRFTWNNVIVHAPSAQEAMIAEKVGLDFFGPYLTSYSRGVDVWNDLSGGKPMDWPTFLCTSDPQKLPQNIVQFLTP
jgi:hypothetical protein